MIETRYAVVKCVGCGKPKLYCECESFAGCQSCGGPPGLCLCDADLDAEAEEARCEGCGAKLKWDDLERGRLLCPACYNGRAT